jgi:hypothetical protein
MEVDEKDFRWIKMVVHDGRWRSMRRRKIVRLSG